MSEPLDWQHDVTEVGEHGLAMRRSASEAERTRLAEILSIQAVEALEVSYRIDAAREGGYHLTGRVEADVTQSCVVSLEPVRSRIDEALDLLFVAGPAGGAGEAADKEILTGPDIEPIDDGRLPVGRIVFETLSAALDPYPRKEGVAFEWTDAKAVDPNSPSNPFAALKSLKRGE